MNLDAAFDELVRSLPRHGVTLQGHNEAVRQVLWDVIMAARVTDTGFQKLWTKYAALPDYDKTEWIAAYKEIWNLGQPGARAVKQRPAHRDLERRIARAIARIGPYDACVTDLKGVVVAVMRMLWVVFNETWPANDPAWIPTPNEEAEIYESAVQALERFAEGTGRGNKT